MFGQVFSLLQVIYIKESNVIAPYRNERVSEHIQCNPFQARVCSE